MQNEEMREKLAEVRDAIDGQGGYLLETGFRFPLDIEENLSVVEEWLREQPCDFALEFHEKGFCAWWWLRQGDADLGAAMGCDAEEEARALAAIEAVKAVKALEGEQ